MRVSVAFATVAISGVVTFAKPVPGLEPEVLKLRHLESFLRKRGCDIGGE
jgi:hypothetical protein